MTKVKEKIMNMLAKWLDNIPDKRPSYYEQLFKMPCYAVSLLQAQSTLMFRQNTRPCAIDLDYDHTVTLYKSTLDIRQS